MTAIGNIAQASLHLVRLDGDWQTGRTILSVPGARKLSEEEAAPFRKNWEDRVQLSAQAQAEQAERMRASEERHQKNTQIKLLMDQLHREATRIAKSMPEDTVFASFTDGKGKVIGKLYQSGAVWFDSNEAARVGGAGAIQTISEQAWAQTKDARQARQIMFDQFSILLSGSGQTKLTLTNLQENPQPAFKADAPLLAIMDKISAIDPEFGSRFDEWRPDGVGGAPPSQSYATRYMR
ncbi:MAG: hypothetical protein ACK4FJ_08855 [Ferrovibrio sp.]|uniref:hypothetical protein n=1 Tax=Ferrovibrio sp. TaxID=1917215 RepID=UPI00391B4234